MAKHRVQVLRAAGKTLREIVAATRLPEIRRVVYRRGLVKRLGEVDRFPLIDQSGDEIRREIVVAIYDNALLGLSGEYSDPRVGAPIEYDNLRIEHDGGEAEITVYNRGIMLLATDDDRYVRIHRVCCLVEKPEKAAVDRARA